jgi:PAS domain S-box-containing protein
LVKILSDRLWLAHSADEKKRLASLFLIWVMIELSGLLFLFQNLFFQFEESCIICNLVWVLVAVLPVFCTINGRIKCSLNAVFALPLILYSYFFSDFNRSLPAPNNIYISVFWLTTGLVFLTIYCETGYRLRLFFVLGMLTLVFQLFKYDNLTASFAEYKPLVIHPLILFILIFTILHILQYHFKHIINLHKAETQELKKSLTKVIQDSGFSIAQLRAERDEAGNIVQLLIERVNNTFESTFKINLYEVQEQKADYIFDLVFKSKFDLNRYIFNTQKNKRNYEFHAVALEKWFWVHVLQPDYQHFFIIFEDITKTKNKIADLEESKRRYKVLLEAIPDMFFVIDKDGTYEDLVIKESALFKVEDANIIGSTIYEVGFPENMAEYIFNCIQHAIQNNSIETIEYSMNTPNGTFMFEMRIAKLNANSVISISRDITKRKTTEFKLEKALIKAEESDKLKSVFLANLSHEIRTPMNVITNFTRILAESELEDQEKMELNDAIALNGKQLLNMIDNTIHLSKIETQSVEIVPRFCNVNALLRDIYNKYFILVPDSKSIRINLKMSVPNKEFGFETDSEILSEILSLLVDNALKYTLKGEITIDYEMIRNEWVKFIITDTGIGIPAEEHKNIFRRFYRVQNQINSVTSGSGLGLAIAQHYIAILGGELNFESELGVGSKFWFELPFKNGRGFLSIVV